MPRTNIPKTSKIGWSSWEKKEPPFLAASTPRDVLEGKIQGIPQAVRRETNGRGIEMQTELPVTEISLDARKSVRDL